MNTDPDAVVRVGWRAVALWRWAFVMFLVCMLAVAGYLAATTAKEMRRGEACEVPLLPSNVAAAETVRVQWMPPRVLCRYTSVSPFEVSDKWETRWRLYVRPNAAAEVLARIDRWSGQLRQLAQPHQVGAPTVQDRLDAFAQRQRREPPGLGL